MAGLVTTQGVNVGDVVSQQQGAGLQAAGYKVVPVGIDPFGQLQYQIVSLPDGPAGGGLLSPGSASSSTSSGTGSTATTGSSTSATDRSLSPEGQKALSNYLGNLQGRTTFGYTPEEINAMTLSPDQEHGIIRQAQAGIAGTADKARDILLQQAAARGNYAPGLNATIERTQQEEGRQAGEAILNARMQVEESRRQAAIAAANARLSDQQDTSHQLGSLITNFPEGKTNTQGTSQSNSNTTSNTHDTTATGPANTQDQVPGGLPTAGTGNTVNVPPGGAGVITKKKTSTPPNAISNGSSFFGFGGY